MKYSWPYYVPGPETHPFFQEAGISILNELKETVVLESCAHIMARPSQLTYVDQKKFADGNGQPFTLSESTASRYLSADYQMWAVDSLCSLLGVRNLSNEQFLEDLNWLISSESEAFRARSNLWHSQLARALVPLEADSKHRSILRELCIIPLSDGQWTSADTKPAFYSRDLDQAISIASDITVPLIDRVVSKDRDRRRLFERLGVKSVETSKLCEYISKIHTSPDFDPVRCTRSMLISHARCLYRERWSPVDLWFATSNDQRRKGSQLYIPAEKDSPTSRIFDQLPEIFPMVHEDYLTSSYREENWTTYLVQTFDLFRMPRLVTASIDTAKTAFRLSDEFKIMFQKCSTSDILHLLHDNWRSYSSWLEPDASEQQDPKSSASRDELVKDISNTLVKTGAGLSRLQETLLPKLDDRMEHDISDISVPILEINDTNDERHRQRLRFFGVIVNNNVHYYITCLKSIKKHHHPQREITNRVYEELERRYDGNENIIE